MQLQLDLTGKTVAITGSTSGIGLGIAHSFARSGANVALNSFTNSDEDHALAKTIAKTYEISAQYFQADMADGDACRGFIADTAAVFGTVDILVNNAGIQHVAPIENFPQEKWAQIIAINLNSVFHTSAAALPFMRSTGWGRIINIASAHGLTASPYKSAYVAAKHGVIGLTKTTALETAEENITCNAICPGYVLTPLVEAQIPDQMKAHDLSRDEVVRNVMLARQPSKDFATVDQIGDSALYLCSSAADQVTGTVLSIDGGWTAL